VRLQVLPYIDSMYNAQKVKTTYLQAGRWICYAHNYLQNNNLKKSAAYADLAIAIINRQDLSDTSWANYYFSVYIIKGNILSAMNNYPLAINNYFKAKQLTDKTNNQWKAQGIDHCIGLILYKQKKYEGAKKYFKLTFRIIKSCTGNNKYEVGTKQELLDNIALCFNKEGQINLVQIPFKIRSPGKQAGG